MTSHSDRPYQPLIAYPAMQTGELRQLDDSLRACVGELRSLPEQYRGVALLNLCVEFGALTLEEVVPAMTEVLQRRGPAPIALRFTLVTDGSANG